MSETSNLKSFKAGEIIMKQGDIGTCAYIIEKGRVEITVEKSDGRVQSVGTRGEGTMIGEMALIDKAPRTATVTAIEDCEFLIISDKDFEKRLDNADPILKMTTHVILTRYRDTLLRSEITGDTNAWSPTEEKERSYSEASNAVERVKVSNEFKMALENGDLHMHYQPIINLSTGQTAGFEALMRWKHPEKGMISPNVFIPIIEETGLINKATEWALHEACSALKRIENLAGIENKLFMSVNFSGSDFGVDGFLDMLYKTISETDLQASQLHIELTERVLMSQPERTKQILELCAKAGMHISIDDFGTGFSSLSYLHYFPINTLKVDRSFVSDMHDNKGSMTLVRSIINLGKNMGMDIIAEGAETAKEVEALQEMECDMVQGFFFAKPMDERAAADFVTQSLSKQSA